MASARRRRCCRRRRLLVAAGWLFIATAPASHSNAQVVPPARDDAADLPGLAGDEDEKPIDVERVLRFAMRGSDLAVTTELDLDDDDAGAGGGGTVRHLRLRGMDGSARMQSGRRLRGPLGLIPYFELSYSGAPLHDAGGSVSTTVYSQGPSVRLERAAQVGDERTNVTFGQDNYSRRGRFTQAPGERVTLRVRTTRFGVGQAPADELSLVAGSVAELLRKHPGPAAKHLAPIFRDFGQDEAVFRVDPRIAWQLFPDAVEPDEATTSRVRALVERLASDDFRAREGATVELEALGGAAVQALEGVARGALTAEQNTRIDAVLARYAQLDAAEVERLRDDPEFLLRCFTYCDVAPVRTAAVRSLGRVLGKDVSLDADAKLPERVRAAETVRAELPGEP